ncbi:MAG: uroporphyrinogen-III synthase [Salinivirgaceae bacterium]
MSGLHGKTFIATCAEDKTQVLKKLLEPKGARVLSFPLIHIVPAVDKFSEISKELGKRSSYQWIIFTSTNGVANFFYWLNELHLSFQASDYKFAVIGRATGESLIQQGIYPHFTSESADSVEFASQLQQVLGYESQKILVPTGNLASNNLEKILGKQHQIKYLVVYKTETPAVIDKAICTQIEATAYDMIFFLSPSAVNAFVSIFQQRISVSSIHSAAIGKVTQRAMEQNGIEPKFVPSLPNLELMVEELEHYYKNNN